MGRLGQERKRFSPLPLSKEGEGSPAGPLDLDDYQRVGKMSQALSLHADEIYQSLASDRQRALCQGMFQALTVEESSNRGIRRPQRLGRLCQILEVPAEELVPIINAYRQSGVTFLMPSPEVELTDQTIIDISHESLMRVWTRLRQWVEEESQAAGIYHRLAESADLHERGKAGLYRAPELGIAMAWREAKRPNAAWAERYRPGFAMAMAYLDTSRAAAEREEKELEAARQRELERARQLAETQARVARLFKRFAGGLAVGLCLAVALTVWAVMLQQEAKRQEAAAQEKEQDALLSQRLAERARAEADENRNLLRAERDQGRQKLYFAEMTLAGIAAEAPAGLGRVGELLAPWGPAAPGADLRGWEWYYLDGQARQAALTLRGHVGPVRAVAYTRDGKRLATGGDDKTIRIWDTATGREIACFRGHKGSVNGVAWSPDGARLATASQDGTARIWDVAFRQELRQLCGPGKSVTAVAWRPDGVRVATTGHDFRVRVWDVDTGREVIAPQLGGSWGMAVAWSPDGKKLAFGSWSHVAKVIDGETGAVLASLPGHTGGVLGVSWSPTDDRLITASWDKTVRVWDPKTGKESAVLSEAEYYLHAVSWSPDGKQIAAGGGNRAVQIWDADDKKPRIVLRGNQNDVRALAWSPDGESLAAASEEGVTRVWDVRPSSALGASKVQPGWTQIKFSPDGTKIAVPGKDNRVRISDATTGELLWTLDGVPGTPLQTRWSPDGTRIACSGWGWALAVWDIRTGKRVVLTDVTSTGRHFALAWSPSGDRIATSGDTRRVCVWDPASGRKLVETRNVSEVGALSWSPDGRQIASARWDGLASIWDAATGGEVLTLRGHSGRVPSVGWSPDGKRIATGSYDRTVKLWDSATGHETLTLRGHAATVLGVHWHPDGGRLATRDERGIWLIWDATPAFLAERSATTLPELSERIRRDPADTTARRLRAEVLARRGDWDAAAVDFAELARLPASAAVVYPAGWWALAGSEDRPPEFPPSAKAAPARWLAPADDPNGFVTLPADGTTAVSRVFAPRRKLMALDIGPVPPGRLWLNEKAIGVAGPGPILVELHEGWNSLAVRGGPSERFVRWRDFDKPADRAERLAFARVAALAAAGHGNVEPPLADAAKAKLRGQALDWLKAELTDWAKLLASDPSQARPAIVKSLGRLQKDTDFDSIRDAAALAKLSAEEREAFTHLWADVAALLMKAQEKQN